MRQSTDVFSLQPSELIKKLQDLQKKNTALNFQLLHCKKKLKKQTKCSKRLQENVSALTSNLKFLNEDQKSALHKRSRKGCVWSAETVKKALQLKFACGSTGYDVLLEQGNPLPSRRTLCRRLQHLSFQPGVLKEIFDIMETKVAAMTDIEKDCVLFMDEMEIRRGLELDRGSDAFLGTTTLPESDQPANHALVFMVGGMNTRWKQVIAYHFTGAYVSGDTLKDFVFHLIRLCTQISLRVLCVTCDMGSSNRAMWRALNLSSSRQSVTTCSVPHPCDEEKELHFMPDPAHVLKNLRGHLVRKDAMCLSDDIVSKYELLSAAVSIQHVERVIELQRDSQLQVASNLTDIHISNGHFTKMKVGIAVQFFREVPSAIRFWIKKKSFLLKQKQRHGSSS